MVHAKKVVLIVDDSPIVIERLKDMLSGLNLGSLIYCGSYSEAVELLNNKQPDITILDIHLPDKNGIELLRYIKKMHSEITVIMLSNQSTEHYKKLCKTLGAEYFVDKSIEFDMVPGLVSSFL